MIKKYLTLTAITLALLSQTVLAQPDSTRSFSIFTGGIVLKSSLLAAVKLGYEVGRFGYIVDITYDNYRETWQDGSRSLFALFAVSGSGRYYLNNLGRSFYGEINLGVARPALTTTRSMEKDKNQSGALAFIGYGVGWRFGRTPKGLFGEIGMRMNFALTTIHLYTTEQKPSTNGLENISYQSWLFESGKESGQVYIGIGYSF